MTQVAVVYHAHKFVIVVKLNNADWGEYIEEC